ncbi:MAG: rhodanese-like domain-containing protein [Woeseiaceae bacterium]|jgi:rhodanese-related sulfurtransferase
MTASTRFLLAAPVILALAACGGAEKPSGSLVDVAQAAARQTDRVDVEALARSIIEGQQDFVLIDIRSRDDYEKGYIGEARHIPLAELVTSETLADLPTDRRIVVYSNGSENGAKAATLLRVAGLDAQVVTGGYNAWHARVLNPDISAEELDGESLRVSEQRAIACYFVGDRGEGAERRPEAEFVPPVFTEDEEPDDQPLPPAGAESC